MTVSTPVPYLPSGLDVLESKGVESGVALVPTAYGIFGELSQWAR